MIELFTTSIFVFSSIYGSAVAAPVNMAASSTPLISANQEERATTTVPTIEEIHTQAKKFFRDDPLLVDIARCESHFRQYDTDGNLFRGKVNKGDIGVMQINEYYHGEKAKALGYDIKTMEGNMGYAKYLYEKEGAQPWISSSPCWKEAIKTAPASEIALRN